ncbi:MAG: TatD family hydrolase [Bacteroidales bacterium]
MIDTHCHIFDTSFDADREQVVEQAKKAGVSQLIMPCIDEASFPALMQAAECFPQVCLPTIGIHPTAINEKVEAQMQFVEDALQNKPKGTFVAVGEIGIDCYWSKDFLKQQIFAFEQQLRMAEHYQLPVIIHARQSYPEIFDVLKKLQANIKGVFHAFSGSIETYHEIQKFGNFKIGIGGVITFKNAKLAEVVAQIPLTDIVLETDAPYLTPTPYRGQRNESAYLPLIVQQIANVQGTSPQNVMETTTQTTKQLFNI